MHAVCEVIFMWFLQCTPQTFRAILRANVRFKVRLLLLQPLGEETLLGRVGFGYMESLAGSRRGNMSHQTDRNF